MRRSEQRRQNGAQPEGPWGQPAQPTVQQATVRQPLYTFHPQQPPAVPMQPAPHQPAPVREKHRRRHPIRRGMLYLFALLGVGITVFHGLKYIILPLLDLLMYGGDMTL